MFLPSEAPPPLPPVQQRLFTGGIFSEEVNDQLMHFSRRHRLTSPVWVPVRCFDTLLKPFGVTLRPAAALLAVTSSEEERGLGSGDRGFFLFGSKVDRGRINQRYIHGSSIAHEREHFTPRKTSFLGFRSSSSSLQHNILANAEHTSHCHFLEQFQTYVFAGSIGKKKRGAGGQSMPTQLLTRHHLGPHMGQVHPRTSSFLSAPPLPHSPSFFQDVPFQVLQCCDHPLTVEGEPLTHLPTIQLMKEWKQRFSYASPYWTKEPPLYQRDAQEKGVNPTAVEEVNVSGWYPIEAHPLSGQWNPVWCLAYKPHTLTNQSFPFLIERLMRERAAKYGYVSRLWLTPEEAWRVFQVTLRSSLHMRENMEDKQCQLPCHDPPVWCSHFTGGLQQDVYYCADEYALSPGQIPRGRETNMAACGVDIGFTKLKPFPLLSSLFSCVSSSTPDSPASLRCLPSSSAISPKKLQSNTSSVVENEEHSKRNPELVLRSSFLMNSATRQERLAALREKYREVRLFDTNPLPSIPSLTNTSFNRLPEIEMQLSRERFLRGFSSPYFLRTTSVLRHGLTLKEDGQQGILLDFTERMNKNMPIAVQQECWVNASQLTEPAVVHELAEHPPTSVVWEQALCGIIAANCARLQLLQRHENRFALVQRNKKEEPEISVGSKKKVARGKDPIRERNESQEPAPSFDSLTTVENKWILAQTIPVISHWHLREGAVGVPFLNYDDASPAAPIHDEYPFIWYNLSDVLGITADERDKLFRYQPTDETSLPVSSVALKFFLTLRALQAGFSSPVWLQLQDPWKEKYLPIKRHVRKPPRRGPKNVFSGILPSDSTLVIYQGEVYMNYEEYSTKILRIRNN